MVVRFRKINEQTHRAPYNKQQPVKGLRKRCFGIYQRFIFPKFFNCSRETAKHSDDGSYGNQRIGNDIAVYNIYHSLVFVLLNNSTAPKLGAVHYNHLSALRFNLVSVHLLVLLVSLIHSFVDACLTSTADGQEDCN